MALLLAAAAGCSNEAPALRVGQAGFSAEELLGLDRASTDELAVLAAFGQAVAAGEAAAALDPLALRDARAELAARFGAGAAGDVVASDDELREAYVRRPEPLLTVRHLVIVSERWRAQEERAEARRRAEAALDRIRAGEPFAAVAAEVSEEPGAAETGGLLDPGSEGSWVSNFWNAAAALEEGEISGVVETQYGFHVLRLEERRAVAFEAVRARAVAESRRDWGRAVAAWAAALGFSPGQELEQVEAASLEALGATSQAARIARGEVAAVAGPLLEAYPVERRDGS